LFVDVLSFEPYRDGDPWAGYAQFCAMILYPLMVTAYRGIEFHPLLRGSLGVLTSTDMSRLLTWRDLTRPGVLVHVKLAARFQRTFERGDAAVSPQLAAAKFSKASILANVLRLRRLLSTLPYAARESAWTRYTNENSYSDTDTRAKQSFVHAALAQATPRWVWDIGCNTGVYSQLAAEAGAHVLGIDADAACINALYGAQKKGDRSPRIQGLVGDLANPSPAMGWQLRERGAWHARGQADFVIALALVHHLAISKNIPIEQFVSYLRTIAPAGVTEFVTKQDPMVRRLLGHRRDVFDDYTLDNFRAALLQHFRIVKEHTSTSGTRVLFQLVPTG
jgi:SAM-dependent methyltransferase